MKKILLIGLSLIAICKTIYSQDLEGSKDPALFPNRMSNYILSEQTKNFDAVEFNMAAGGSKNETKEGTKRVFLA